MGACQPAPPLREDNSDKFIHWFEEFYFALQPPNSLALSNFTLRSFYSDTFLKSYYQWYDLISERLLLSSCIKSLN